MVPKNSGLSKNFAQAFAGVQKAPSGHALAICVGCVKSNNFNNWLKILRGFNARNWVNLEKRRFEEVFNQTNSDRSSIDHLEDIMDNALRGTSPTRKKNVKLTNTLAYYCDSNLLQALAQVYFSDLEVEVLLIWIKNSETNLLQRYVNYLCQNCSGDERSKKTSNWNSRKLPLTLAATFLFSALTIYFLIGLASVPHYIAVVALLWFVTTMSSAMLFGLLD